MIDGEKRIVTFVGEGGKRTATIIWREYDQVFEVLCEKPNGGAGKLTKFFRNESEAQTFAEEFTWREKYGAF
jgi:hypothetical protein